VSVVSQSKLPESGTCDGLLTGRLWKVFYKDRLLFFSQAEDSAVKFAHWFARQKGNLAVAKICEGAEEVLPAAA
jgi:hypothetical protein